MPISLISGLPGGGKTLRMMQKLEAAVIENARREDSGEVPRPLVVIGVDGLQPGPYDVRDEATTWATVPDGALVFVDEAWKWFGHLQSADKRTTPPHVLSLAEHRHRGIDFIWTTQEPRQLYPFARALIGEHEHVVRLYGSQLATVYKWGELREDVKGSGARAIALSEKWSYPKAMFGRYKSAASHSIKLKIPRQLWYVVCGVPLILGLMYAAGMVLLDRQAPDVPPVDAAGLVSDAPASDPSGPRATAPPAITAENYLLRYRPRIAAVPWSAEAYDSRDVTAQPTVACMSSAESCSCITEQGTRYILDDAMCRQIARHGPPYNPFKRERDTAAKEDRRTPGVGRPAAYGDASRSTHAAPVAPVDAGVDAGPVPAVSITPPG